MNEMRGDVWHCVEEEEEVEWKKNGIKKIYKYGAGWYVLEVAVECGCWGEEEEKKMGKEKMRTDHQKMEEKN